VCAITNETLKVKILPQIKRIYLKETKEMKRERERKREIA
jgi:hypothetical protein